MRSTRLAAGLLFFTFAHQSVIAQSASNAPSSVVVASAAPIFVLPDQNRVPLRIAKEGSVLTVVKIEGEWYNVEFADPDLGRRVGYVQQKYLKTTPPTSLQPVDVSIHAESSVQPTPALSGAAKNDAAKTEAVSVAPPTTVQSSSVGSVVAMTDIRRIFIEKMSNDLDQYISAEIAKQLKGRVMVVLRKQDSDAILRGVGEKKDGVGAAITGRYLGLHDNATGSISLVDRDETVVLWSGEAGDRSLMWGAMARGGPRKVAGRLVGDLKKALGKER